MVVFFFQAEDGIRDLVRSRGLGDVYKRQLKGDVAEVTSALPLTAAEQESVRRVVGATNVQFLSLIHI